MQYQRFVNRHFVYNNLKKDEKEEIANKVLINRLLLTKVEIGYIIINQNMGRGGGLYEKYRDKNT